MQVKQNLAPYHFVRAFDELFQRAIVGFEKKNVSGTFKYDHLIVMGSGIRNCENSNRICLRFLALSVK